MKKILLCIALFTGIALVAGCGSGGSSSSSKPSGINTGVPSKILLQPTSSIAQTNAGITLKTRVLDGNGDPVPNETVFFTNLNFPFGSLSAASLNSSGINAASSQTTAITDAQGFATVVISSPTEGFATVLVQVSDGITNIRDIRTVFFTASNSFNFSPTITLDVDGDGDGIFNEPDDFILLETATDRDVIIRATVLDGVGLAAFGARILFATDAPFRVGADPTATCSDGSDVCEVSFPSGNLVTTNSSGEAFVFIRVTPATLRSFQTVLNVLADADNGAFNIISLFLDPVTVSTVMVFANPSVVESAGTSTVTASGITNVGTQLPEGTTVNFTVSDPAAGIEPFAQTDDNGIATAQFAAQSIAVAAPDEVVVVTATVGSASGMTNITVTAPAP